jgi:hypothetical protein
VSVPPAADGQRAELKARLRPLYATAFLQNFALWYSVEKLFMRSIGLNDYLITLATVAYVIVMAAGCVPVGVLADRWSRKGTLHLATGFLMASTVICGLARGFGVYVAGYVAWGLFFVCYSVYDSVVYDTVLEVTGSRAGYETWYGRVQQRAAASFICGGLASAVLVHFVSLRLDYFLTVPVTCCAFWTLARFREPLLHRVNERRPVLAHLSRLRGALTASPRVGLVAAALTCDLLAVRMVEVFCQLWWLGVALPAALFGPSYAALYAGSFGGGLLARRVRRPGLAVAAGLAASLCLLVHDAVVIVAALIAVITVLIMLQVVLSGWLHDAMPSDLRAGASSAPATVGMLLFIPAALGFGSVAGSSGIFTASWFLIGTLAAMAALVACVLRGRTATAAPAAARPQAAHAAAPQYPRQSAGIGVRERAR